MQPKVPGVLNPLELPSHLLQASMLKEQLVPHKRGPPIQSLPSPSGYNLCNRASRSHS